MVDRVSRRPPRQQRWPHVDEDLGLIKISKRVDRRARRAVARQVRFESVKENQNWNRQRTPATAQRGCAVLGVGAVLGLASWRGWTG